MKNIIIMIFVFYGLTFKSQILKLCNTNEYKTNLINANPNIVDSISKFNTNLSLFRSSSQVLSDETIFIPIVFHIINDGTASPVANVTDAQIINALVILNNAFVNQNSHINGVNCKFQFCLAKADQSNNPINGITRHYSSKQYFLPFEIDPITGEMLDDIDLKSYGFMPSDKYLNIWIADIRDLDHLTNTITDGVGYTLGPIESRAFFYFRDGIVLNYKRVGSTGTAANQDPISLGKTLVHEVGHWLGLEHTFEYTTVLCENSNCLSDGDKVCDTPPVFRNAFFDPQISSTSCAYRDDCNGNFISAENYMEYNYDNCRNFYTQGQKDLMRYNCMTYRNYFWTNSINSPQTFPIECTSPSVYTPTGGGGTSSSIACTNSQMPSQLLFVNGVIGQNLTLCNGTPVIINRTHNGNCTGLPIHQLPVPCSEVIGCSDFSQNLGLCDCVADKVHFWLSISYNCDGSFNCQNEVGSWFAYPMGTPVPEQIDIASMLNFQFQPNQKYSVKLAGVYYNLFTSTWYGWQEGIKHISFVPVDLYETGNVASNLEATNSITFENATIPSGYSSYTATNLIRMLPNTSIFTGSNSRLYLSSHTCSSNVFRVGHQDTVPKNTKEDYHVIQYPKKNSDNYDNENIQSISKNSLKSTIKIMPNPSNNGVFEVLDKNNSGLKIEIYNNLQVLVTSLVNTSIIDLSNYSPGIYFAYITNKENIYYEKLIYNK